MKALQLLTTLGLSSLPASYPHSVTSRQLIKLYLNQIAQYNGYLKAVIAVAPEDVLDQTAAELDEERTKGIVHRPLHGIPILVKVSSPVPELSVPRPILIDLQDNIATATELGLPTTCGSLALEGSKLRKSANIIERVSRPGSVSKADSKLPSA